MDKKNKLLIGVIALALIIAIASTTYAYFTIANKEGEESVITSGTMGLHLEDGPEVGLSNAIPGASVTKSFYVENTGNVDTAYDIYLSEVVNTFVDKTDLVYSLISSDGGYSTNGQVEAPSISSKIVDSQPISVGGIHHYTLLLTFLEKNENQDDNQGVEFSGKIQINEYIDGDIHTGGVDPVDPTPITGCNYLNDTCDLETVGNEVCFGTECFYVIGKEDTKAVLLGKYNLNVGNYKYKENGVAVKEGLQSEHAVRSYNDYYDDDINQENYLGGFTYGAVPFYNLDQEHPYWEDSSTYEIKPNYTKDAYGYYNVYDSNSNLYQYMENYVSYLNNNYHVNVTGRIPNKRELLKAICKFGIEENVSWGYTGCNPVPDSNFGENDIKDNMEWMYNAGYWTSNPLINDWSRVWSQYELSGGYFIIDDGINYLTETALGVRPVILIES